MVRGYMLPNDSEHTFAVDHLQAFQVFRRESGPCLDRVRQLITETMPARVPDDTAYRNVQKNSDEQNARIEHDRALVRVMTAVMKDDTELFKQFSDNESFRRWLGDTVFDLTYDGDAA